MIDLFRLARSIPADVRRKLSLHDLRRIAENYNTDPVEADPLDEPVTREEACQAVQETLAKIRHIP